MLRNNVTMLWKVSNDITQRLCLIHVSNRKSYRNGQYEIVITNITYGKLTSSGLNSCVPIWSVGQFNCGTKALSFSPDSGDQTKILHWALNSNATRRINDIYYGVYYGEVRCLFVKSDINYVFLVPKKSDS